VFSDCIAPSVVPRRTRRFLDNVRYCRRLGAAIIFRYKPNRHTDWPEGFATTHCGKTSIYWQPLIKSWHW